MTTQRSTTLAATRATADAHTSRPGRAGGVRVPAAGGRGWHIRAARLSATFGIGGAGVPRTPPAQRTAGQVRRALHQESLYTRNPPTTGRRIPGVEVCTDALPCGVPAGPIDLVVFSEARNSGCGAP